MQKNNKTTLLLSSIILLSFFCCISSAAQESTTVQNQFRDFYTPLIPGLQANYSNVKFVVAGAMATRAATRITCYRGAFQGTRYIYDEFPPDWIQHQNPDLETIRSSCNPNRSPRSSGGWNPEYQFTVWYNSGNPRLAVFDDGNLSGSSFNAFILAPVTSLWLEMTYADIMDSDFEFIRFFDRNRNGVPVKSLFYRPGGKTGAQVFEADFDPTTGACVSSREYMYSDELGLIGPVVIQVSYSDAVTVGDELPKPAMITGSDELADRVIVLEYDRVGKMTPRELSVEAYGFDESEALSQISSSRDATSGAIKMLKTLALVLFFLLVLVVALVVLIKLLARNPNSRSRGDDFGTTSGLSE